VDFFWNSSLIYRTQFWQNNLNLFAQSLVVFNGKTYFFHTKIKIHQNENDRLTYKIDPEVTNRSAAWELGRFEGDLTFWTEYFS
jgi:hypothetical protein